MVAGVIVGAGVVAEAESGEADLRRHDIEIHDRQASQELVSLRLREGDSVIVELCSEESMAPEDWSGRGAFEVWYEDAPARVGQRSLTEAQSQLRTRGGRGCMTIASAIGIPAGGQFVIRYRSSDANEGIVSPPVSLRARSFPESTRTSSLWFWLLLGGMAGLVLGALWPGGHGGESEANPAAETGLLELMEQLDGGGDPAPEPRGVETSAWIRVVGGIVVFAAAIQAVGWIGGLGRAGSVWAGVSLAALECALALLLSWGMYSVLALRAPVGRLRWWLVAAPLLGPGIRIVGGWLRGWIPVTGEAPIEALISWPSGALAVGVVAMCAPLCEELFFRGFIFGWVERARGGAWAFATSAIVFTAAHAFQTWGAWDALASVALVGIVTSALRWSSGSTIVPMIVHVAYNTSIVAKIV